MPLLDIDSNTALKSLRNKPSIWPDGRTVTDRLKGVVKTSFYPKFTIERSDRIFTMGSCFARNIERRLASLGFDVPLANIKHEIGTPKDEGVGIMNKYTVHSMVNELQWASNSTGQYTNRNGEIVDFEDFFIEEEPGKWFDPHFHGVSTSIENLIRLRKKYDFETKKFSDCNVFIFTLGLAETWYDSHTNLYLNRMPPISALKRDPSRFRFQVLSCDDIISELKKLYQILKISCKNEFRIMLTVSPIPFKMTFTGGDALVANTYSKSVQRAAAEELRASHPNIDYFPSYEIVTLTNRAEAYEQDNIHAMPNVVDEIMDRVVTAYSIGDTNVPTEKSNSNRIDLKKRRPLTAQEQLNVGKSFMKDGDFEKAAISFSGVISLYSDQLSEEEILNINLTTVSCLAKSGQKITAVKLLEKTCTDFKIPEKYRERVLDQYSRLGMSNSLPII